uniref:C-type lectin domain-containing protein n=1 Tax=Varanus komodoensis TaxID=61221 RepID=A0A8D2LL06_VARKO
MKTYLHLYGDCFLLFLFLFPEFTNGCKLCPVGWTLHKDNCYWFSKGKKNWTQSHNDCRAKNSSLPVLQTQEEMVKRPFLGKV